jgi:dihydrofolate reductase
MTTDHTTTNPGGSAKGRRVVANVTLSLDGRTAGPAGDGDMGWLVPHALSDAARDHMMAVTTPATTVLLGRKNHEGFAGFWPPVADDPSADPRDRAFSSWLTETDKVVFSSTLTESAWTSTTVTANAADAVVRALRAEPGGDIVVLASSRATGSSRSTPGTGRSRSRRRSRLRPAQGERRSASRSRSA